MAGAITLCALTGPRLGYFIMTNSSNGDEILTGLLEGLLRNTVTPVEWERFKPVTKD